MSVEPIDVPSKANYVAPNAAAGVAGASTKVKVISGIVGLILVAGTSTGVGLGLSGGGANATTTQATTIAATNPATATNLTTVANPTTVTNPTTVANPTTVGL